MVDVSGGRPVAGLLFDKDGTLFDFRRTWAAWADGLLKELAGGDSALAARLAAAIGFLPESLDFEPGSLVIAGTPDEVAEVLLPLLPGRSRAEMVKDMNLRAARVPLGEVVPLVPFLAGLRAAGLKIGLATNDAEAPATAHLSRSHVLDAFDFIAGCDSGYGAKPRPGQLLAFCARTGLEPREVAMIGDSRHDLEAARAAGMIAVAVLTGIATREDLAPHADLVLNHIGELPAWLTQERAGAFA